MKIKQNLDYQNKEYNAIFEHIHLNTKACTRSKKSALIEKWENIIAYWK